MRLKVVSTFALVSMALILGGCGGMKKHNNVDSAILHIQNLEYDEAMVESVTFVLR